MKLITESTQKTIQNQPQKKSWLDSLKTNFAIMSMFGGFTLTCLESISTALDIEEKLDNRTQTPSKDPPASSDRNESAGGDRSEETESVCR